MSSCFKIMNKYLLKLTISVPHSLSPFESFTSRDCPHNPLFPIMDNCSVNTDTSSVLFNESGPTTLSRSTILKTNYFLFISSLYITLYQNTKCDFT